MAVLEPQLTILDETDSGLDIDALRVVATGINEVRADRPELGMVLITHYRRLLDLVQPDHVHILVDGRIAGRGGMELVDQLERSGDDAWTTASRLTCTSNGSGRTSRSSTVRSTAGASCTSTRRRPATIRA